MAKVVSIVRGGRLVPPVDGGELRVSEMGRKIPSAGLGWCT